MPVCLCRPRINLSFSFYKRAVRSLYVSHFGGGVADTVIPNPDAVLSQVLILSRNKSHILLGKHKHGAYKGRWTGLIGEVKGQETPVASAHRIVSDHGIIKSRGVFSKCAILNFVEADGSTTEDHVFVTTTESKQVLNETDMIIPKWFPTSDIPFRDMPADDEVWYPQVLSGRLLRGTFVFDGLKLLRYSLHEADSLECDSV